MEQKFVDKYIASKEAMLQGIKDKFPEDYADIVKRVVTILGAGVDRWTGDALDPERITTIDHGEYQGTLVFVIAEEGYQPSNYWATAVSYGSCSGCDTLAAIESSLEYDDDYILRKVTDAAANDVWTLGLHLVQRLTKVC
jgi:hypothetical protein